jgi:acyl-CoA thioesterase
MKKRFIQHVGVQFAEQPAGGRARCTLKVEPHHANGTGVVHGGVLFTLADTAMGAALFGTLAPGQICATIEIKIGYFKPVFAGELVCEALILSHGKSVASLEATVHVDGVLVSKASGTFAIFMRKMDASLAALPAA